ncbi:MAG: hypothetical protein NUV51_10075 [Sulfuricaulis sp.]|nr:hypothetical protein [Sulfuricaulis sp.]
MDCHFRYVYLLCIFMPLVFAPGCATITSTVTQPITVTTRANDGQPLEKVDCALSNESGKWQITTPGVVSVERSAKDLMVECKKEGHPDGFAQAISRTAPGMWGNIILFAGVGAIIDHSMGTGYDYPSYIAVKMGTSVTVDRREQDSAGEKESTDMGAPTLNQPQKVNQPLMDDNKLFGP